MSVTAVLFLLLCCWSLSLTDGAAALGDDEALAGGDVGVNDDVATLMDRMNALERSVSEQGNLNQELTTRLARQDRMLLQQGKLIQQLRSAIVSRAPATTSRASATRNHDAVTDATGSTTPNTGSGSGHDVAEQSDSGRNVTKLSDSGYNITKQPDAGHNVVKRSDDDEPLLAVVNQISQRVTEQGAELQALKAQTTANLNTFKVQTTADINALKDQTTADINVLKDQTTADVQTLQNSDRQQETGLQDARTSTFVRWGSSTCSASSSLVYSGVVGGSWWEHTGAATNHLCLTLSPVFSQRAPPSLSALLYGAEFETQDLNQDKDPLCAVCRAAFSTTVMVPGTDTCSAGWHLNYSGYLMAGLHSHAAGSQYICVDSAMQSAPHSGANHNGKLLYYTLTQCGSLPCGPYVNNKVVTCAVCSK